MPIMSCISNPNAVALNVFKKKEDIMKRMLWTISILMLICEMCPMSAAEEGLSVQEFIKTKTR